MSKREVKEPAAIASPSSNAPPPCLTVPTDEVLAEERPFLDVVSEAVVEVDEKHIVCPPMTKHIARPPRTKRKDRRKV